MDFAHIKGDLDEIIKKSVDGFRGGGRDLFVDIRQLAEMAMARVACAEVLLTTKKKGGRNGRNYKVRKVGSA